VALVLGFTASATAVFFAVSLLGDALRALGAGWTVVLPVALAGFAVIDFTAPRIRCSLVRRQTPKELVGRFHPAVGGLLWGLDTGSMVSTFRAAAASWAALVLAFAGWAPPWCGLVYAAAFGAPLLILTASHVPQAGRDSDVAGRGLLLRAITADGTAVAVRLLGVTRAVRLVSAAILAFAAVRAAEELLTR
jgi:hypothetical protein